VGKTRLALQLAGDVLPHFADGVTFVSLATVGSTNAGSLTVAQAIILRQTGDTSPLQRLKNHLQFSRALLVLDNFE
jgi:predicted ATPase